MEKERTLILAQEFIDCIKAGEKMGYASLLLSPGWVIRKKFKKSSVQDRQLRILEILMGRYEGVICQLLNRAGVIGDLQESLISRIWFRVQDKCLPAPDYRRFSSVLWEACTFVTKAPALCLKPKLMLRQFVDEMQPSDERGILISRAYSSDASRHPFGKEILPKLMGAYALLHQQLLNHEDELEILTDGAMTSEMIRSFRPPFVRYKQWLFDSQPC